MATLRPIGKRIIIEAVTESVTAGGIILAESAKEKPQTGIITAVGDEVSRVTVGDLVLFPRFGGTDLKFEGKTFQTMGEGDLFAVIDP